MIIIIIIILIKQQCHYNNSYWLLLILDGLDYLIHSAPKHANVSTIKTALTC